MITAILTNRLSSFVPEGFAVSVFFNWREWAFGWCSEFVSLGAAGLVLGPVVVQSEWSIL